MSTRQFMHGGLHFGLLHTKNAEPISSVVNHSWTVRVYDIGEMSFVGVLYPDRAKQVQPLNWWPEIADEVARRREQKRKLLQKCSLAEDMRQMTDIAVPDSQLSLWDEPPLDEPRRTKPVLKSRRKPQLKIPHARPKLRIPSRARA
jgi:hypothetical protein